MRLGCPSCGRDSWYPDMASFTKDRREIYCDDCYGCEDDEDFFENKALEQEAMAAKQNHEPKTHHIRIGDVIVFPEIGDGPCRVRNVNLGPPDWESSSVEIEFDRVPIEMAKAEQL